MLTGVHLLMTYKCNLECDHCFVYSSPRAEGTMSLPQIRGVLDESRKIGSVEWIYFEGGEPFLFYPSMLEGIKIAGSMGFRVGVVTNAYGAISEEDAEVWLRPLAGLGVDDLSISDDSFHSDEGDQDTPAKRALAAAQRLGIPTSPISIQKPFVEAAPGEGQEKGDPVIGGGAMFKGRAVEKLTAGLPRRPWQTLSQCPHEDLQSPSRVHVDHYGNVHICQGLSMGNMWRRPLSVLALEYAADSHPVCGPLAEGGPALLANRYNVDHESGYVDECHFCYLVRRALIDRFPYYLAPRQVYGFEEE
jgi:hypothetical protein